MSDDLAVPFQPQILKYSINEVRLSQVDTSVFFSLDIYPQEVLDISFDRNVKLRSLDVFNYGFDLHPVGTCQYGVVRIQ